MLYSSTVCGARCAISASWRLIVEKDFETVWLLDTYGSLLTEKQLRLCDMYYNQDYSLSEIAKIESTTRQAARDGIGKARQKLRHYEACLGLCAKRNKTLDTIAGATHTDWADMQKTMDEIAAIWERKDGI